MNLWQFSCLPRLSLRLALPVSWAARYRPVRRDPFNSARVTGQPGAGRILRCTPLLRFQRSATSGLQKLDCLQKVKRTLTSSCASSSSLTRRPFDRHQRNNRSVSQQKHFAIQERPRNHTQLSVRATSAHVLGTCPHKQHIHTLSNPPRCLPVSLEFHTV